MSLREGGGLGARLKAAEDTTVTMWLWPASWNIGIALEATPGTVDGVRARPPCQGRAACCFWSVACLSAVHPRCGLMWHSGLRPWAWRRACLGRVWQGGSNRVGGWGRHHLSFPGAAGGGEVDDEE